VVGFWSYEMSEMFDVVVIGSGPGGYFAAIRCAQKGATVAIVEKGEIGGTCLNCGCIPSKTLLASAEVILLAKHAGAMGVDIPTVTPNWGKIQQRKDAIVTGFRKGLTGLIQANKIKIFRGTGIVTAPKTVTVEPEKIRLDVSRGIIIATGSIPIEIPAFPFDGQTIISSNEALSLQSIPASMVVVGGGIIGCELACAYAAAGTKVVIVEALERIINTEDAWVGQLMERELKKSGIGVMTNQKVISVDKSGALAKVILQSPSTGSTSSPQASSGQGKAGQTLEAEKVLVAVGRRAVCDKETIDALGLKMNGAVIAVDKKMRTNVGGVYAIGDAVGTTYLAHGAFAEAEIAAENIAGGDAEMGDYSLIPQAVYTFPEIASVGKTEQMCNEEGIEVTVGRGFFKANGRSVAHNETAGEVRVVRDKKTDKILGVTMVGAHVTEMIAAGRLIIGTTEKFHEVSFPHPSVSEVLKESWEDAFGMSVHQGPRVG
jgi:dihydrolipoamide dehydrogenase